MSSQNMNAHLNDAVDPVQAQVAQIPLQSFNIPVFPPEALAADVKSLILTSDMPLHEYPSLLQSAFSIPALPQSVTSLTLELFSLG